LSLRCSTARSSVNISSGIWIGLEVIVGASRGCAICSTWLSEVAVSASGPMILYAAAPGVAIAFWRTALASVALAPLAGGMVLLLRYRERVRPASLPSALAVAATLISPRGLWGFAADRLGWSLVPVGYRVRPPRG